MLESGKQLRDAGHQVADELEGIAEVLRGDSGRVERRFVGNAGEEEAALSLPEAGTNQLRERSVRRGHGREDEGPREPRQLGVAKGKGPSQGGEAPVPRPPPRPPGLL